MADGPLDEKVWSSYQIAQEMGGIHTNTILPYFQRSIFFDPTSNNAIATNQALYNPNLFYVIETRQAFERHLRTMSGLEFMVTQDPSQGDIFQKHSGIWVIRKQRRQKRSGQDDEITPLNSFFVVGLNVYMAPSFGDVLGNRMLSYSLGLTQSLKSIGLLTMSSDAQKKLEAGANGDTKSSNSLRTTQNSGDETPAAGAPTTVDSTRLLPPDVSEELDLDLLGESLTLSLRHRDEYMDENPLVGEPGSFVMRKSRTDNTLVKPSQVSKAPTPLPPPIETNIENPMTKGSNKDSAKTPITPGGSKKRKKSRVLSTTTPK